MYKFYIKMVGSLLIQLILNAFFFTFIFWLLTFIAKYSYSNKFYNYKLNFYECGFKNFNKKGISYELNFLLFLLFLLIYDGEFLVLVPMGLNPTVITWEVAWAIVFFFIWLIITLLFDYSGQSLEWQV